MSPPASLAMRAAFVSEGLIPVGSSFDTALMARGEPGLPHVFRWRKQEWHVAAVLEQWKEHGDCRHGSGERYVRKHFFRVQTAEGPILRIYFQRSAGRGCLRNGFRWWVQAVEPDRKA